ncbi:MAG TPA: hypothetical protein VMR50_08340 [Myxococcota bacterium]|nr:hypothetical protein [Myxococcota bacterium]
MRRTLSISLRALCCGVLAAAVLAGPRTAKAEDYDHPAMSYVGAGVASLLYFPAKVAFAVGGAVTSGVAYAVTLGRPEPSDDIWRSTVEGDYVVTPDMIDGHRAVHFVGA